MATPKKRTGQGPDSPRVTTKKDPPLTQTDRNKRWLASLEEKAKKGLPVPRRVNLILSPEAYAALEAIRKSQGGTKTDVIATLLIARAKKLKVAE